MIDITKYGTPIQEDSGFINKTDISKYGEQTTPTITEKTQEKTGVGGLKGFAIGATKSALAGATGTASLLQGLGQRGLALLTPSSLSDVRKQTGVAGLTSGTSENIAQEEMLKRYGTAEKLGGYAETAAEIILPTMMANKGYKISKTLDYLKNTPETLTAAEEKIASLAGRVKTTLTGMKKILASDTEKRAAQILKGKISSNVTKNPQVIQNEIATRGAEVEQYLAKNPIKITAEEQSKMFMDRLKTMEKSLDKNQLKAFKNQWDMFIKQIPGRGGFTTENFYKALKDYEQNVASNLARGKAALLDPTGVASAKIQGAKMVRDIVRKTISSKHPEFSGKMFDLASLYDVLDTALTKSRQLSGTALSRFAERNPITTKVGTGAALIGGGLLAGKTLLGGNQQNLGNINSLGNSQ